ncbi:phosphate acyltransferase [Chlamydiifrater phoenicopteri]|uniref:phosphate acyltransferase n=1 Tax=Chlamydiifrater phoenicopteri TaxID=2681469 RepID=UPI001FE4BDA3|nr:phosphate acyltransferase [Chlamydiifrater phoenicopteri]
MTTTFTPCVAVDLMGGDHSPILVFRALLEAIRLGDFKEISFLAIAQEGFRRDIELEREKVSVLANVNLRVMYVKDFVSMEDSPLSATRKKDSSMSVGLDLLSAGKVSALFSTGNTGALITLSRLKVSLHPTISRPALTVRIPTLTGSAIVLDVGANVAVKPEELVNFARMGEAYRKCLYPQKKGKVALLNIGSEERKGTESHRVAFKRLQEVYREDFLGNIEGGDVFSGKADVVVTDGFTGNIFLKTAEGVFDFLLQLVGSRLEEDLKGKLNYSIYPGSVLCGLSKLVVKCHGEADEESLVQGIFGFLQLSQANLCDKILRELG